MSKKPEKAQKSKLKIHLGMNILRAIRLQEVSVQEWAEANNFPLTSLHRIIRAEANPTLDNLIKISEKLKINFPNLFKE